MVLYMLCPGIMNKNSRQREKKRERLLLNQTFQNQHMGTEVVVVAVQRALISHDTFPRLMRTNLRLQIRVLCTLPDIQRWKSGGRSAGGNPE